MIVTTVRFKHQTITDKNKKPIGRFHIIKETTEPSDIALSLITNKRMGIAYSRVNADLIINALNLQERHSFSSVQDKQ